MQSGLRTQLYSSMDWKLFLFAPAICVPFNASLLETIQHLAAFVYKKLRCNVNKTDFSEAKNRIKKFKIQISDEEKNKTDALDTEIDRKKSELDQKINIKTTRTDHLKSDLKSKIFNLKLKWASIIFSSSVLVMFIICLVYNAEPFFDTSFDSNVKNDIVYLVFFIIFFFLIYIGYIFKKEGVKREINNLTKSISNEISKMK